MTRPHTLCSDDSSPSPCNRKRKLGMQAHAMCKDPWGAGAGITPWGSGMRPSERAISPGPDPMTGPAKVATKRGHTTGEARGAADETGEALRAALACTNDENRSEQRSDDDIRPRTQPHPPRGLAAHHAHRHLHHPETNLRLAALLLSPLFCLLRRRQDRRLLRAHAQTSGDCLHRRRKALRQRQAFPRDPALASTTAPRHLPPPCRHDQARLAIHRTLPDSATIGHPIAPGPSDSELDCPHLRMRHSGAKGAVGPRLLGPAR